MFDGERFRAECEEAVHNITSYGTGDPAAASRAKKWAGHGAALIDDQNAGRATRYLLALIGNLADQNALNTQRAIIVCTRRLLVPLWVAAAALLWIAFRS